MKLPHHQMSEGQPEGADVVRVAVPIDGLSLGGCGAELIERVLASVPGVRESYVNRVTETAYITYDTAQTAAAELRHRIERAGFRAGPTESWRLLLP